MRKLILAAALAAASPALAQVVIVDPAPPARGVIVVPETTGSVVLVPRRGPLDLGPERGSDNPSADGNAEQTNKPVPNYGTTSDGPAARFE